MSGDSEGLGARMPAVNTVELKSEIFSFAGIKHVQYRSPGFGAIPRGRRNPNDREGMCHQLNQEWARRVPNQVGVQKTE